MLLPKQKLHKIFFFGFAFVLIYFLDFNEIRLSGNNSYAPINRINYPIIRNFEKKDWHDWNFIEYEQNRSGPGERGKGIILTDPNELIKNNVIYETEGLNALISDKISVNRSITDFRHPNCLQKKYLKHLPKVSIIVVFYNEYQSILHRTLHSIYNRTPKELLHEIILVNDNSNRSYLYQPLEKYVNENFMGMVKILNLKKRSGLIKARMEGAKLASSEILIFLDAHIEVNTNWLPPLIEPMVLNPLVVTTPVIDFLNGENFEVQNGGDGFRGIFDWNFFYKWLPKKLGYVPDEPSDNPIMLGCAFAINRQFFWDLGAYDEELQIWNGENYELSLKLWLCGGKLLEVPCSRIAHTFRKINKSRKGFSFDFEARNFKRIAEVWLDEYKELLYKTDPNRFAKVDAGDLTKPKMIRKSLKCKPFKYFLDVIAPDMLERYPIVPRPDFAFGKIISQADPTLCIDSLYRIMEGSVELYECENATSSEDSQFFNLTWNRNIKYHKTDFCLDAYNMVLAQCSYHPVGNQFWKYDLDTHQISLDIYGQKCLTADLDKLTINLTDCNLNNSAQKWSWEYVNETALRNWCKFGREIEGSCK